MFATETKHLILVFASVDIWEHLSSGGVQIFLKISVTEIPSDY